MKKKKQSIDDKIKRIYKTYYKRVHERYVTHLNIKKSKKAGQKRFPWHDSIEECHQKGYKKESKDEEKGLVEEETKAITELRYDTNQCGYYVPYFDVKRVIMKEDENGTFRSEEHVQKLVKYEYIDARFSPVFLGLCKKMVGKWIRVPLGAAKKEEENESVPLPDVVFGSLEMRFGQGNNDHCLSCAVASMLHYTKEQFLVSLGGRVYQNREEWGHIDMMKALFSLVQKLKESAGFRKSLGSVKLYIRGYNRKSNKPSITIDDLVKTPLPYPAILVPIGSDGATDHCVGLIDGLVFDPRQKFVSKMSKAALNLSCYPATCDGLYCVVRFEPNSPTSYKRKVRDNRGMFSSKKAK